MHYTYHSVRVFVILTCAYYVNVMLLLLILRMDYTAVFVFFGSAQNRYSILAGIGKRIISKFYN